MIIKEDVFKNFYLNRYKEVLPYFKEKKTQAFTTLAFTLITLSIFGIFAISPTISTIAQLRKELDDNRHVDEQLQQKIINLGILQTKYIALEKDLPFVLAAVPTNPQAPTLVGQLYALAQASSITVNRLQTFEVELSKTKEAMNQYSSFGFVIELSGSYTNTLRFIDALSTFNRVITVDTISMNRISDQQTNLKTIIRGKSYFKK